MRRQTVTEHAKKINPINTEINLQQSSKIDYKLFTFIIIIMLCDLRHEVI